MEFSDGIVGVPKDALTPRCIGPNLTCMEVTLDDIITITIIIHIVINSITATITMVFCRGL